MASGTPDMVRIFSVYHVCMQVDAEPDTAQTNRTTESGKRTTDAGAAASSAAPAADTTAATPEVLPSIRLILLFIHHAFPIQLCFSSLTSNASRQQCCGYFHGLLAHGDTDQQWQPHLRCFTATVHWSLSWVIGNTDLHYGHAPSAATLVTQVAYV